MNLFALTNISGSRILRLPLSQQVQADIQTMFDNQFDYFMSDIDTVVPFDGRYTPEDGELLSIENFIDIDGLADAVAAPLKIEQYRPEIHPLNCIKALFTEHRNDNGGRILVQIFENRRLIANKGFSLTYSDNTFKKMSDAGLTLDTKLLATLEGGTLKFQSFHFARRVFELGEYFKDATNEEVNNFASHPKLFVSSIPEFLAGASAPLRKKIALIRQSGTLEKFTTDEIISSASDFNLAIEKTEDGRISVPNNATEIRRLLRFLDEDHYLSPLSQTHYISNSKRVAT